MSAPRTYRKLEKFLTNLAYVALIEPGFYDICAAAGVVWTWPKFFGGEAVLEFVKLGGLTDPEKVRPKLRTVISSLERDVENLSQLPTDIESMRIEYRELAKVQRALDVAYQIIKDPESYDRFILALDERKAEPVETIGYDGIAANYELVRLEIEAGKHTIENKTYPGVTELIGGFNPGRITFLLGTSGYGKTNLAMNLAYGAAWNMDVGFMNLEMTYDDLSKRTAVMLSQKTWKELNEAKIMGSDLPKELKHDIRFSNGRELHVEAIMAWSRAYKRTNPDFGILFIDYDQKMDLSTSKDCPEWKAMQIASRALEDMAKDLKIHIVMCAQINSEGYISSSKRSIYTAHSVLTFRQYEGGAVIENSYKHRHAPGPKYVPVKYDENSPLIREMGPVSVLEKERAQEKTSEPKERQTSFGRYMEMQSKKG